MAPARDALLSHCTDLLAGLGAVRSRRMFGGHGIYVDDLFIALIARDVLYLKTDMPTRGAFEAAGCLPFAYDGAGKTVTLGYFSAPEEALESPPLMEPWARLAMAAALRARAAKPSAARRVTKARPSKGASTKAPSKP